MRAPAAVALISGALVVLAAAALAPARRATSTLHANAPRFAGTSAPARRATLLSASRRDVDAETLTPRNVDDAQTRAPADPRAATIDAQTRAPVDPRAAAATGARAAAATRRTVASALATAFAAGPAVAAPDWLRDLPAESVEDAFAPPRPRAPPADATAAPRTSREAASVVDAQRAALAKASTSSHKLRLTLRVARPDGTFSPPRGNAFEGPAEVDSWPPQTQRSVASQVLL